MPMPPMMPQRQGGLLAMLGIDGQSGHGMLKNWLSGLMGGNGGTSDMGRQQGGMGQAVSGLMNPTNPGMPGMMTPGSMGQGGMFSPMMQQQQPPQMMGGGFTGGRDNPRRMMMQRMGSK